MEQLPRGGIYHIVNTLQAGDFLSAGYQDAGFSKLTRLFGCHLMLRAPGLRHFAGVSD